MRQELNRKRYEAFSLLWKDYKSRQFFSLDPTWIEDINIKNLQDYFSKEFKHDFSNLLHELPINKADSLYRQQVIHDFTIYDNLYKTCLECAEKAHYLMGISKFAFEREATVYNLIKRMDDVVTIREMLESVYDSLKACDLKSDGLIKYRELLSEIIDSNIYDAFMHDVNYIKSLNNGVKSIQIGLNLDEYLQPVEAILLEISSEEFKYSRFGKKMGYYVEYGIKEIKEIPRKLFARETVVPPDALNALEKTIEPATLQLIKFCDQFTEKILEVLNVLYYELPYFQIGVELFRYLEAKNLPLSLPTWGDNISLEEMYNVNLGFSLEAEEIVKNDLFIEQNKSIIVLTGANRGGKTTMTQGLSQALWFAQLGFYVPAKKASLPYLDSLLIHFAHEETNLISYGRLGEECQRFKKLFNQSSSQSIYCMNESFSGTSHQESLQLALETLKAIYEKGARVIFNTHLHELVGELEKLIPEDSICSLIAGRDMASSPYLIEKGSPLGKSYALEIAKKYHMTYEQLMEERG